LAAYAIKGAVLGAANALALALIITSMLDGKHGPLSAHMREVFYHVVFHAMLASIPLGIALGSPPRQSTDRRDARATQQPPGRPSPRRHHTTATAVAPAPMASGTSIVGAISPEPFARDWHSRCWSKSS
jgi:hypothetical protein